MLFVLLCGLNVFVPAPNIDTIVSLAKRRGFVFPSSEVYGGLGSAWDYGPLGVELCNNVKQAWWRWLVYERDDIEGIDSSIILNRLVWKYSGHEATFQRSARRLPRVQEPHARGQTRGYFPKIRNRFRRQRPIRAGLLSVRMWFDEPDDERLQHDVANEHWALPR